MSNYKLSWIFNGLHADGTATHYLKHLHEFAKAQQITFHAAEIVKHSLYAVEVFVVCSEEGKQLVEQRLKPHSIIEFNPDVK